MLRTIEAKLDYREKETCKFLESILLSPPDCSDDGASYYREGDIRRFLACRSRCDGSKSDSDPFCQW